MRFWILLPFFYASLFGFSDDLRSFSAAFTQTITDDTNETITYEGRIDALRPDRARWIYSAPVVKSVYVEGRKVTIVEPELEQAIIKSFKEGIDLFKILAKAEKLDDETYLAVYESRRYLVKISNDILRSIAYRDAFDNRILIRFADQKLNPDLPDALFTPDIPEDYDLLSE